MEIVPDAQGLNYHKQHLFGSVVSAGIPPGEAPMHKKFRILIEIHVITTIKNICTS